MRINRLHNLLHNAENSLKDGLHKPALAYVGFALELVKKSEKAQKLAQARYRSTERGKAAAIRGRIRAAEKRNRQQYAKEA